MNRIFRHRPLLTVFFIGVTAMFAYLYLKDSYDRRIEEAPFWPIRSPERLAELRIQIERDLEPHLIDDLSAATGTLRAIRDAARELDRADELGFSELEAYRHKIVLSELFKELVIATNEFFSPSFNQGGTLLSEFNQAALRLYLTDHASRLAFPLHPELIFDLNEALWPYLKDDYVVWRQTVLRSHGQRNYFDDVVGLLRASYAVVHQERLAIERLREGMSAPTIPMTFIQPNPATSRTTGPGYRTLYIGPLPERTCAQRSADEKEIDDSLLRAAQGRSVVAARSALGRGACIDARDERGWTPLIHALKNKNRKMTRFLLSSGAAVNVITKNGFSALSFAIEWGDPAIVRDLLERGASPDLFRGDGRSPMFTAIRAGPEMVELLLDYGASVDGRLGCFSQYPQTPFMAAAQRGEVAMMRVLLERGADPNATIIVPWRTTQTLVYDIQSGANAAMYAVESGDIETVRFVLDSGVDLHHVTSLGDNAFYWAVQGGDLTMVEFLLSHGAWHPDAPILAQMHRDPKLMRLLITEERQQNDSDEHE